MSFDHFERCLCQPIAKFVRNRWLILVQDSNQVLRNKFWMICHQFPNRRSALTAAQKMGVYSRENIMVCNPRIRWLWILSNCAHQNLTGPRFFATILNSFVRYWIFKCLKFFDCVMFTNFLFFICLGQPSASFEFVCVYFVLFWLKMLTNFNYFMLRLHFRRRFRGGLESLPLELHRRYDESLHHICHFWPFAKLEYSLCGRGGE